MQDLPSRHFKNGAPRRQTYYFSYAPRHVEDGRETSRQICHVEEAVLRRYLCATPNAVGMYCFQIIMKTNNDLFPRTLVQNPMARLLCWS